MRDKAAGKRNGASLDSPEYCSDYNGEQRYDNNSPWFHLGVSRMDLLLAYRLRSNRTLVTSVNPAFRDAELRAAIGPLAGVRLLRQPQ